MTALSPSRSDPTTASRTTIIPIAVSSSTAKDKIEAESDNVISVCRSKSHVCPSYESQSLEMNSKKIFEAQSKVCEGSSHVCQELKDHDVVKAESEVKAQLADKSQSGQRFASGQRFFGG